MSNIMWKPMVPPPGVPLYEALVEKLETAISHGDLLPGDRLPPQRQIADMLEVNLSTVSRALTLCVEKGLLSTTVGRGTFVALKPQAPSLSEGENPPTDSLIDMGSLFPSWEPLDELKECITNMCTGPELGIFFQYGQANGTPAQREAASLLMRSLGYGVPHDNILLSSGAQNAMVAVLASLFNRGDAIGTDSLTYPGIKTAAKMLDMKLIPILHENTTIDEKGIQEACATRGMKGLFIMPENHNPTTNTMSEEHRQELARIVKENDLLVIEEAGHSLDSLLTHRPFAFYAPQHTVFILSLSKIISPGLRLAFVAPPERYFQKLFIGLHTLNISVSAFMAELGTRLITTKEITNIIEKHKAFTQRRNQIFEEYLGAYDTSGSPFANFRWLRLPKGLDGGAFELRALQAGVRVLSAKHFSIEGAQTHNAVRLAVTSPKNEESLRRGLIILKDILENLGLPQAII